MEDLECLICFEEVKDARACPKCAKIFCHGCIGRCAGNPGAISCPHCRTTRPLVNYVKLVFVDRLRKEWSEKEEITKATFSKLDQLQLKLTKYDKKFKEVSLMLLNC